MYILVTGVAIAGKILYPDDTIWCFVMTLATFYLKMFAFKGKICQGMIELNITPAAFLVAVLTARRIGDKRNFCQISVYLTLMWIYMTGLAATGLKTKINFPV